jgi:hypothetical protein
MLTHPSVIKNRKCFIINFGLLIETPNLNPEDTIMVNVIQFPHYVELTMPERKCNLFELNIGIV